MRQKSVRGEMQTLENNPSVDLAIESSDDMMGIEELVDSVVGAIDKAARETVEALEGIKRELEELRLDRRR